MKGGGMSTITAGSELLVTVKAREVQRGAVAEMSGDGAAAVRHLLAAAHLELVLSDDYLAAGDEDLALRAGLSAISCFWRAGEKHQAQTTSEDLRESFPHRQNEIQQTVDELQQSCTSPPK